MGTVVYMSVVFRLDLSRFRPFRTLPKKGRDTDKLSSKQYKPKCSGQGAQWAKHCHPQASNQTTSKLNSHAALIYWGLQWSTVQLLIISRPMMMLLQYQFWPHDDAVTVPVYQEIHAVFPLCIHKGQQRAAGVSLIEGSLRSYIHSMPVWRLYSATGVKGRSVTWRRK